MTEKAIHQYFTRGSYFKAISDREKKKFLCDSLKVLFYLIIILYTSSTGVNQNMPIFLVLPRLSTEENTTLLTFMHILILFGLFETMTLKIYMATSS